MGVVVFDVRQRRVSVGSWTVRATWVEENTALAKVNPRAFLRISTSLRQPGRAWVDLWTGEPDNSGGLAVVTKQGEPVAIATIPPCECGDWGCANAGRQLGVDVAAEDVPKMLGLLRSLPIVHGPANPDTVWDGDLGEARL